MGNINVAVASSGHLRVPFAWSDVAGGSLDIGTVDGTGPRVAEGVEVDIDVGFDGGTLITVGTAIAHAELMTVSENDPTSANRYRADTNIVYAPGVVVKIFFPAGAPTVGSGSVTVMLG